MEPAQKRKAVRKSKKQESDDDDDDNARGAGGDGEEEEEKEEEKTKKEKAAAAKPKAKQRKKSANASHRPSQAKQDKGLPTFAQMLDEKLVAFAPAKVQEDVAKLERDVRAWELEITSIHNAFDSAFHRRELEKRIKSCRETIDQLQNGERERKYLERLRHISATTETETPALQKYDREKIELYPSLDKLKPRGADVAPDPVERPRTAQELLTAYYFSEHLRPEFTYRDVCPDCRVPLLLLKSEALLPCCICGRTRPYINMTNSAVSWGQATSIPHHDYHRIKFVYRRLVQYHEHAEPIPARVLFAIKRRLLSYHQSNHLLVKPKIIKDILDELGLIRFRPFKTKITSIINQTPIAEFTAAQFNEIIERIYVIQKGYFFMRNKLTRVNFPHFSFLVNVICRTNGWDHLAACFPVQKTDEVLRKQEDQWKKFFIPYLIENDTRHRWCMDPSIAQ